jgi:topoisomerase IV subunit A
VIRKNGIYRLTNFDLTNHYEDDILVIEKFNPDKIWTAIHYDASQEYFYLKRFQFEETTNEQVFIAEEDGSNLIAISDDKYPQVKINFAGKHSEREPELIDAEEFIAVKSFRARGKRITTYETGKILFDEPLIKESEDNNDSSDNNSEETNVEDNIKNNNNTDSPTQMSLEL